MRVLRRHTIKTPLRSCLEVPSWELSYIYTLDQRLVLLQLGKILLFDQGYTFGKDAHEVGRVEGATLLASQKRWINPGFDAVTDVESRAPSNPHCKEPIRDHRCGEWSQVDTAPPECMVDILRCLPISECWSRPVSTVQQNFTKITIKCSAIIRRYKLK